MTDNKGEIIIYIKEDGRTQIDVKLQGDSLWLSQRLIAELFEKDVNTINDHIRNIYEEKELTPETTTAVFATERRSTRPLQAQTSILAWKKKQPTFYISLSRTILSPTATNALPPSSSSGFWKRTASSIDLTAPASWRTTHWWRLL
ncbi:MAG TPA: hypothetical protein VK518_22390 [Puia sp.]|nr:hypothetical protein [Puia sp.]